MDGNVIDDISIVGNGNVSQKERNHGIIAWHPR